MLMHATGGGGFGRRGRSIRPIESEPGSWFSRRLPSDPNALLWETVPTLSAVTTPWSNKEYGVRHWVLVSHRSMECFRSLEPVQVPLSKLWRWTENVAGWFCCMLLLAWVRRGVQGGNGEMVSSRLSIHCILSGRSKVCDHVTESAMLIIHCRSDYIDKRNKP